MESTVPLAAANTLNNAACFGIGLANITMPGRYKLVASLRLLGEWAGDRRGTIIKAESGRSLPSPCFLRDTQIEVRAISLGGGVFDESGVEIELMVGSNRERHFLTAGSALLWSEAAGWHVRTIRTNAEAVQIAKELPAMNVDAGLAAVVGAL